MIKTRPIQWYHSQADLVWADRFSKELKHDFERTKTFVWKSDLILYSVFEF